MKKNAFYVVVVIINFLDVIDIWPKNAVVSKRIINFIFVLVQIVHGNSNSIYILFHDILLHYDDHRFHIHSYLT